MLNRWIEVNLSNLIESECFKGTPDYKDEACATLRLLSEVWKPKHAMRVADTKHIKIMCNILKSSNTKYISCAVALIHSVLKACATLKADFELQRAKDLIKVCFF